MASPSGSVSMSAAIKRGLFMGLACLPVGFVAGAWLASHNLSAGWTGMLFAAPAGSFLAGFLFWLVFQWRTPTPGQWRGLLAGLTAGAAGHWFCWYLLIIIQNLRFVFLGEVSSLGEPPLTPLQGLWGACVFTFFSIVIMGWATIPAGGAIGFFMGRLQRRKASS